VIKWNDVAENMVVIDQYCKICQKELCKIFFCATRKKKEKDNKNII
jgi:hypothetical protein